MRQQTRKPLEEMQIDQVKLELNSRDDIPQVLGGLQYIFLNPILLEQVLKILEGLFPKIDLSNGRPGMDMWSILVMGVLRLNLNCDYDRLHNLVNNHKMIRQILGHGIVDDQYDYYLQTLKDNVSLLTPEMLDRINQVVVNAGHQLIKKKDQTMTSFCYLIQPLKKNSGAGVIHSWWKPTWNIQRIPVCCLIPCGK
jgi:IS5 family transposase